MFAADTKGRGGLGKGAKVSKSKGGKVGKRPPGGKQKFKNGRQ